MNKDRFSTDKSSIAAEACAWIAQLETGELTKADQDAFREWMSRSPKHAAEIKHQAQMSQEMNLLSGMAQSLRTASRDHSFAISRKKSRPTFALGAAIAAFVLCVSLLILTRFDQSSPVETSIYKTAIGESQTITLRDGSVIQLNTNSQVEVTYDRHNRKVRLISGEVFFDVERNTERPFWVFANDHRIRVVGTAFLVSLIKDDFELLVTEGRVELAATPNSLFSESEEIETNYFLRETGESQNSEPIALIAGQGISFSEARQLEPLHSVGDEELRRELSWQEGLHDFSNTPLGEVVSELSRYSGVKYEFTDSELRDLKFGGVFRIGETERLFEALETAYGIRVSYLDDQSIQLSRDSTD